MRRPRPRRQYSLAAHARRKFSMQPRGILHGLYMDIYMVGVVDGGMAWQSLILSPSRSATGCYHLRKQHLLLFSDPRTLFCNAGKYLSGRQRRRHKIISYVLVKNGLLQRSCNARVSIAKAGHGPGLEQDHYTYASYSSPGAVNNRLSTRTWAVEWPCFSGVSPLVSPLSRPSIRQLPTYTRLQLAGLYLPTGWLGLLLTFDSSLSRLDYTVFSSCILTVESLEKVDPRSPPKHCLLLGFTTIYFAPFPQQWRKTVAAIIDGASSRQILQTPPRASRTADRSS